MPSDEEKRRAEQKNKVKEYFGDRAAKLVDGDVPNRWGDDN